MKRHWKEEEEEEEKERDVFSHLPNELYPVLMSDFTIDVPLFKHFLSLRTVSKQFRFVVEHCLSQVSTLDPRIIHILRDKHLIYFPKLRELDLTRNTDISLESLECVTSLQRIVLPSKTFVRLQNLAKHPLLKELVIKSRDSHWPLVQSVDLLTNLTTLEMVECDFSVPQDLNSLVNLRSLSCRNMFLYFNEYTRDEENSPTMQPLYIAALPKLERLDLRGTPYYGIPSFANLLSLKLSNFHTTTARTSCSAIHQLSSLTELSLDNCWHSFTNLVLPNGLRRLSLKNWTKFVIGGYDHLFTGLSSLTYLNLSFNTIITDKALSHLVSLESLNVSRSAITDAGIISVSRHLTRLVTRHSVYITGISLTQLPGLIHLKLSKEPVASLGQLLRVFTRLEKLEIAELNTTFSVKNFAILTSLKQLTIYGPVDDKAMTLTSLTKLEKLHLFCTIGKEYRALLSSLTLLKSLKLGTYLTLTKADLKHNLALSSIMTGMNEKTSFDDFEHLPNLRKVDLSWWGSEIPSDEDKRAFILPFLNRGITVKCTY